MSVQGTNRKIQTVKRWKPLFSGLENKQGRPHVLAAEDRTSTSLPDLIRQSSDLLVLKYVNCILHSAKKKRYPGNDTKLHPMVSLRF